MQCACSLAIVLRVIITVRLTACVCMRCFWSPVGYVLCHLLRGGEMYPGEAGIAHCYHILGVGGYKGNAEAWLAWHACISGVVWWYTQVLRCWGCGHYNSTLILCCSTGLCPNLWWVCHICVSGILSNGWRLPYWCISLWSCLQTGWMRWAIKHTSKVPEFVCIHSSHGEQAFCTLICLPRSPPGGIPIPHVASLGKYIPWQFCSTSHTVPQNPQWK